MGIIVIMLLYTGFYRIDVDYERVSALFSFQQRSPFDLTFTNVIQPWESTVTWFNWVTINSLFIQINSSPM